MFKKFIVMVMLVLSFNHAMGNVDENAETSEASDSVELEQALTAEQQEYLQWAEEIWNKLDRQTGVINIEQAGASLNVPEEFYFLNSVDATTVLVDVWGNPPGQPILGMLFPADSSPFDGDAWAVTIEYEEDGYVSDEDAAEIDYNDLLKQMKKDTRAASKDRVAQGYDAIELIGWAATPYYDQQAHKLHWAKEIKFGEGSDNTLNYNIRVLGRKGVLVLNFIAGMDQKPLIEDNLDSVLALANFEDGSRYSDFNPDIDKVAAYGLGGLVAGKVLAKTGILAAVLLLLKKFGVFIFVGIAALFKSVFGRKA